MEPVKKISVEVAYALPSAQKIISLVVEENCRIEVIIERSGILEIFPEIDLTKQKVGVFGHVKKLTDTVKDNDRIEIYRKLLMDPKDVRRRRSALESGKRKK